MEKYYFIFKDSEQFPYKNTYLIVVADSYGDAINGFRNKYPDVIPGCLNCSDCYDEKQWDEIKIYYANRNPIEIIWTDMCFGRKIEGYDALFIYVSEMKQIVRISEGIGDNLLEDDLDQGYVDYVYYEQYELSQDMSEIDGGQIMLKNMLRDQYQCMTDCIPDVLEMAYGSNMVNCIILA